MKIICNPPFKEASKHKKDWKNILTHTGEWVILATWRFCNGTLEQQELVMPMEWPDIQVVCGIASSYEEKNKEEQPDFYEKRVASFSDDLSKNFILICGNIKDYNKKSFRGIRCNPITKESFIRKASNGNTKRGEKKDFIRVFPKGNYDIFLELIVKDNTKWCTWFDRSNAKIRKEIVDEVVRRNKEKD